jgi:hypothetical protein
MTREEKCKLLISKGYTYNKENGKIFNASGLEMKTKHNHGYIYLCFYNNKKQFRLLGHHFAWFIINNEIVNEIDHINGMKHDNSILNLRSVTREENSWNMTKAKGYSFCKRDNLYYSRITVNKNTIHLGSYKTAEDARKSYLDAKKKYHVIN